MLGLTKSFYFREDCPDHGKQGQLACFIHAAGIHRCGEKEKEKERAILTVLATQFDSHPRDHNSFYYLIAMGLTNSIQIVIKIIDSIYEY